MGFYNLYPNRKDYTRVYPDYDVKSKDRFCQNHKSCSYCRENRYAKHYRQGLRKRGGSYNLLILTYDTEDVFETDEDLF